MIALLYEYVRDILPDLGPEIHMNAVPPNTGCTPSTMWTNRAGQTPAECTAARRLRAGVIRGNNWANVCLIENTISTKILKLQRALLKLEPNFVCMLGEKEAVLSDMAAISASGAIRGAVHDSSGMYPSMPGNGIAVE